LTDVSRGAARITCGPLFKTYRRNMKKLSRLIAVALALAAGPALAQNAQTQTGVYLIGGIGQSMADFNSADYPTEDGFERRIDDKDTSWNIGVGYRFHRYVAVELGYANLGEFNVGYTGTGAFAGETANFAYEVSAWKLAAAGIYPINEQFSLIGKLGVALSKAEVRATESDGVITETGSASKSRSSLLWGLGAQYDFNRSFGVRAEYENYGNVGSEATDDAGTGRAKVSAFSLNVVYRFQ
jgi:OmpA-OmpF porin, OOP family